MQPNEMDASERAMISAGERLTAVVASLHEHMRASTARTGPASENYLDSIELALRAAGEFCHALTRLRDVVRARVRN